MRRALVGASEALRGVILVHLWLVRVLLLRFPSVGFVCAMDLGSDEFLQLPGGGYWELVDVEDQLVFLAQLRVELADYVPDTVQVVWVEA